MKKILIAMTSLHNGGAERSLVNLLQELPPDRYELDLLLFKNEGLFLNQIPAWVNKIDPPAELKLLYSPVKKAGKLAVYKLTADLISRLHTKNYREKRAYRWENYYSKKIPSLAGEYDTAVAYMSEDIMAFIDRKVKAKRKIVFVHSDYRSNKFPKEFDEPHFANMDAMVTISQTCVDILKEVFPQFSDKIVLLENITSSRAVRQRAEEFKPEGYEDGAGNLLSIGRLVPTKNFTMAVDAAALLDRRGVKFKWRIIGTGEQHEKLQKQIESLDLSDKVSLLGAKENPYPYLSNSDVMIQSSLFEGKSIVLDEAKILAVPIVATEYPTVRDQVLEGKEGLIVPITPEGIADGIEKLLKNEDLRLGIKKYLSSHEYGNTEELKKYMTLFEG